MRPVVVADSGRGFGTVNGICSEMAELPDLNKPAADPVPTLAELIREHWATPTGELCTIIARQRTSRTEGGREPRPNNPPPCSVAGRRSSRDGDEICRKSAAGATRRKE
jgi:hypothetical protein